MSFKEIIEEIRSSPEYHTQGILIEVAEQIYLYIEKHKLSKVKWQGI